MKSKGFVLIFFVSTILNAQINLVSPRLAKPVLCVPGDTIEIIFKTQNPSITSIILSSEFSEFSINFGQVQLIDTMYYVDGYLPQACEPGLYTLILNLQNESDTQFNSIRIFNRWRDTIKFLHFTDIHIGYSARESLNFERAIREANIINPDFIIITGDIVEKGQVSSSPDWYREFLSILKHSKIPAFVVSGNHDWYNWFYVGEEETNYLQIVNPFPNYTFNYGNLMHFLCLDTGPDDIWGDWDSWCYGFTPEQLAFIEQDLIQNQDKPLIFAMMHGPVIDYDDNDDSNKYGKDEFITYATQYNMDLILAGHTHEDRLFLADSTWIQGQLPNPLPSTPYFMQTTTTCKNDSGSVGYRMVIADVNGLISFSEEGLADKSIRMYNLKETYSYNTDSTSCLIKIFNYNSRTFYDGRVYPRMKTGYNYQVSGPASFLRQAITGLCEIEVESIIPGTTVIYIEPVEIAENTGDKSEKINIIYQEDYIKIINQNLKVSGLKIFDITGRKMIVKKIASEKTKIDISKLRKGIYFIVVEHEYGRYLKRKFIKF